MCYAGLAREVKPAFFMEMGTRMAENVNLTLPDGGRVDMPNGSSIYDLASKISRSLAKNAVAGKVDDRLVDLNYPLHADARVEIIVADSPKGLEIIRHSTAHIMASAVKELYPEAKVTIGPAIDDAVNGFYYDFDYDRGFKEEDLDKISRRMKEIIAKDFPFERIEIAREEAGKLFTEQGEDYKLELIDAIEEDQVVSLYKHSGFVDLCRGPHLPSTKKVKAFKLMSVAGAYWRGDSDNKMLARIYGNAFGSKKLLDEHLLRLVEAKKRDHRLLGKQLDLFSFSQTIGGGLVLWHPKGAKVRSLIEEFWRRSHSDFGYDLVYSPHIGRASLWHTSGHLDFYSENMYSPMEIEGNPFYVKPMNCPFHIEIYKSNLRSFRELPVRLAELGTVYRYEPSGTLHGLFRVRGFTQDDAHIFCRPEQLDEEIRRCLKHTFYLLGSFGFNDFEIFLSTQPEKFVGEQSGWDRATQALRSALEKEGLTYFVDPGEGVFYGPKIDIKIRDSLARTWQCTTIQVDFNLPERFHVEYVDTDNKRVQPFMVHRALLGSMERFFGVLLEHHAGRLPAWLAPMQVAVLPVTKDQIEYARNVSEELLRSGLRVNLDDRSEKLGFKVREAQLSKVPFMLIVGRQEVVDSGVSMRVGKGEDLGFMPLQKALERIQADSAWPEPPIL
jgi:threonyl-tRNA synthetase